MRKFLVGLVVLFGLMGVAYGLELDKVSVGASYAVNYIDAGEQYHSVPNGWLAEVGYNISPCTAIIGEVGVGYEHGTMLTAMGGVRYMLSMPVELPPDWLSYYVQALGGVAHKTGENHGTGLAAGVGAGVLIKLDKHWDFKVAQVDYIHQFGEVSANVVRFSCGVHYRF